MLGVVIRIGSYLDLAEQTKSRRRWRHLCGLKAPVHHEIFGYATERMNPEDWRQNQARVAKELKRNKALGKLQDQGLALPEHRCQRAFRQLQPHLPALLPAPGRGDSTPTARRSK